MLAVQLALVGCKVNVFLAEKASPSPQAINANSVTLSVSPVLECMLMSVSHASPATISKAPSVSSVTLTASLVLEASFTIAQAVPLANG